MEVNEEEQKFYEELGTRAASYKKLDCDSGCQPSSTKKSKRNTVFLKCKEHNPVSKKNDCWKPEHNNCESCFVFNTLDQGFPNSVLPTAKSIIEYLLYLKETESTKGRTEKEGSPEWLLSKDVTLHWIFCNVYPITLRCIEKKVNSLWTEFKSIRNYVHNKKGDKYWADYETFISKLNQIIDLRADEGRTKTQEKLWGCKMTDIDRKFYKLQCQNPPTGYCTTFVDKKWAKTKARQEARKNRCGEEFYEFVRNDVALDEGDITADTVDDPTFVQIESSDETVVKKKAKYEFIDHPSEADIEDDMPRRFRNIRSGLRSVRAEIYSVMHKLKSTYHMSQRQCEAAIVEVGNYLFERKWKFYDKEKPTDPDTLPSRSNTQRSEPYFEAMALASIVEEVMNGSKASVMYANDGSAMSGVGNYVVQSLTIDGVQRVLPTFSIFTETRESLKELEIMTLNMLCASVGYKYTEKQILERINFVMTDSTSHNLNVIENVCEHFEAASPKSLVCNVHPLMMFQRKVKDVFQLLHDTLGKDRIVDCFLVDVDFAREDFITKALKCLTSFINKDFSAKPWNRQKHFDSFISPKSNESLSYKDHRFNRLFQCCMVLVHHIDDIAEYLDVYRNIVNGISILDRSFVEMTLLKPVFCAAALIGIHVTLPFQSLLAENKTNYSTLLSAFPILYNELKTINPEDMCTTANQVFHFVSNDIFKMSKPKDTILHSITTNVEEYKSEVVNLLKLMLPGLADGFATQRGKIFGFGPEAESPCRTFKISSATNEEMQKLNKTATHNLGEERSVGHVNYELGIRGKANLEASSRKLILNKSFNLLEKSGKLPEYRSYRKAAQDIKAMKIEWNEKMKRMEADGNLQKDTDNNHVSNVMYTDLEYLKARNGPFTKLEEVLQFDQETPESKEKNKRLYIEVRYTKNTCLSLKHTASVFRLKRDHKNLTSKEYVENLCQYLGDARSKTVLTVDDLSELLMIKLNRESIPADEDSDHHVETEPNENQVPHDEEDHREQGGITEDFASDENVSVVWMNEKENVLSWYLGVIDSVSSENINVTYYNRRDKNGISWTFPDDDGPLPTPRDQVIYRNITVSYMQTSVIRCNIDKNTVKEIKNAFDAYVSNLE